MFLEAKRWEEGHDFFTEGFPATIQFIRDQLSEVGKEADFFLYFLSLVSFAYSRRPNIWYFRFKSVERVGNCVVRSLDVGKVWQESLVSFAQCGLLVYNFGRPQANKINRRNLWWQSAHKAAALISKAIESSVNALVSSTNALTDSTNALMDMYELLMNWVTPLMDTTNALTDTDELLTNCLTPLTIFIESSNGLLTDR